MTADFQHSEAETGVLVVENDAIVRAWVRLSLEGSEFRLAGEASTVAAALELAVRRAPAILLVDYRLPDGVGTELVHELRRRGCPAPAVVMTASEEQGLNEAAREAGAQGTVLKSDRPGELLAALRAVSEGGSSFDPRHPRRPAGQAALSRRERQVLRLAAGGATNRQIAETLEVSLDTVKTLLARSFAKLGVARRAEAVSEAFRRGLL